MRMTEEYFDALLAEAKATEEKAFAIYNSMSGKASVGDSEWEDARANWNRAFGYVTALGDIMANTNRGFARMVKA